VAASIDYYFSLVSPWAYLGHAEFLKLAERHAATVAFRPVNLGRLFPESGGLPLAKRHPLRQAYRLIELQRWREKRDLPLVLKPRHWPFDQTLADQTAIAVAQDHPHAIGAFLALAFRAVWAEEQDLGAAETLRAILASLELPAAEILAKAGAPATAEAYEANLRDALAVGAFGSPTYVVSGELFWGQDRLEMLDEMLASGREPYALD
jgi:2-hydroxychromene-2-carboxylate isomerase